MYVHICTQSYMYICTHAHTLTCNHVQMHIYTYVHMHACTYVQMFTCTRVYMYTHMLICKHVQTYLHKWTHVHIYICTYKHAYNMYTSIRGNKHTYPHASIHISTMHRLDAVAKSVEPWSRMWEIVGSKSSRVKPMTYKIDTCRLLVRCSALLG